MRQYLNLYQTYICMAYIYFTRMCIGQRIPSKALNVSKSMCVYCMHQYLYLYHTCIYSIYVCMYHPYISSIYVYVSTYIRCLVACVYIYIYASIHIYITCMYIGQHVPSRGRVCIYTYAQVFISISHVCILGNTYPAGHLMCLGSSECVYVSALISISHVHI